MIEYGKADVNIVDNDNASPLHMVASRGNEGARIDVAKLLVSIIVIAIKTSVFLLKNALKLFWL